jgi:hypothetical protein
MSVAELRALKCKWKGNLKDRQKGGIRGGKIHTERRKRIYVRKK